MPKQALVHHSSSNRKRMGLVTVLLPFVSLVATPAEATGSSPGPSHQQITHIVLLSGKASPLQVAADHGLGRVLTYSEIFKGFAAVVPEGRFRALSNDPRVIAIEENTEFQIQADPVATVEATSQTVPTGVRRIDCRPHRGLQRSGGGSDHGHLRPFRWCGDHLG